MIVAERKPFDEIMAMINGRKKILVAGCGTCVAVCLAGGEKEVGTLTSELKIALNVQGKSCVIKGTTIERQCDMEFLDPFEDDIKNYDAVISMACGAGVQFFAERYPEIPVFPAVNTTAIAANRALGVYEEKCRACGRCVLGITGGICPVTMCAKSLFNGPCGGTNKGNCEISSDQPCAWNMIYERLSKQDRLNEIMNVMPAMNWANQTPRTTINSVHSK